MFAMSRARSLLVLGCAALPACGTAPPRAGETSSAGTQKVAPALPCALPARGAKRIVPVGRQGSAVALARADDRLLAFVADRLAKRIDVVDVNARAALGTISLQGAPEEVLVLGDGRIVVSLGDRAALQTLSVGPDFLSMSAGSSCLIDVPRGPSGLAASEDGRKLVVTSSYAETLSILDATTLVPEKRVAVGRSPKSVVVESGRAFISHLAGDYVSVVDLPGGAPPRTIDLGLLPATEIAREAVLRTKRRSAQAYSLVSVELPPVGGEDARRGIVLPEVSVDPGSEVRSTVYYGPPPTVGIPKEAPVAVRLDIDSERALPAHVLSLGREDFIGECLLPRAAAFRASTARLYVACRGIDEVLELDARATEPMRNVLGRFAISQGVTGMAVADAEGLGVAFGEFDSALDIVRLADGSRTKVDLSADTPGLSESFRTGRALFYRTNDPLIAFDGLACASCHPDGGDDGVTWSTPEGPRQTPMLAGRVHGTAPYGWTRAIGTLPEYIQNTVGRLGGRGLSDDGAVALASFLERMPAPGGLANAEEVERGHDLFVQAGCATCHAGAAGTDHASHVVTTREHEAFDTPSLRFIGLTAPYFHDGRYATLDDLLGDPKSDMGTSARLSAPDRRSLARFLESL